MVSSRARIHFSRSSAPSAWKWKVFPSTVIVKVLSSSSSIPMTAPFYLTQPRRTPRIIFSFDCNKRKDVRIIYAFCILYTLGDQVNVIISVNKQWEGHGIFWWATVLKNVEPDGIFKSFQGVITSYITLGIMCDLQAIFCSVLVYKSQPCSINE